MVKNYINKCLYDSWGVTWKTNLNFNRHTKMFFPEPNSRLSKRLLMFNREELSYLIKAITGHNYLKHFSNKILTLSNTKCRLCKLAPETFYHLTNDCASMKTHQLEFFNNKKFEGKHTKWNPVNLLKFLNIPQIKELFCPPK